MELLVGLIVAVFILILGTSVGFGCWFTVQQQTISVVQRLGRFNRFAHPGLNFKLPFVESVTAQVSMRTRQLLLKVETKTKDNVFVHVSVAVQFLVMPDKVYASVYSLQDPESQITAFVFNVVRAHVPSLDLDDVFLKKDEIAEAIKRELAGQMSEYGFQISNALVTDIDPDERVKTSMNEINANQRLLEAAKAKAEAEKILRVKAAEADAESKALQGNGVARERMEIARGLKESSELFAQGLPGATVEEAMIVLLMTQYFDMLRDIGSHSNTIMLPHSPAGMSGIANEIREAIISGRVAFPPAGGPNGNPAAAKG